MAPEALADSWAFVTNLGILSAALLAGVLLRARWGLLRRYFVPANLVGGLILLLVGSGGLGLVPVDLTYLGVLVYHALPIILIAINLRPTKSRGNRDALAMGLHVGLGIYVQAFLALGLTLLLMITLLPDLPGGFGMLAPLGFAMGPGQAYSLGLVFEEKFGLVHGVNAALAFAGLGFLWSCAVGIPILTAGIRAGRATLMTRIDKRLENVGRAADDRVSAGELTTRSETIETLALHVAAILVVYLATYGFLYWMTGLIAELTKQDSSALWGVHFIFANLFALIARHLLTRTGLIRFFDRGILTRIANLVVDFMVVAGLGAISISLLAQFWLPLLVLTLAVGAATSVLCFVATDRFYGAHRLERAVVVFGVLTGTFSTGMVLLRILDPHLETPVAEDFAFATAFVVPPAAYLFFALIFLPQVAFAEAKPSLYFVALGAFFVCVLISLVALMMVGRNRQVREPTA